MWCFANGQVCFYMIDRSRGAAAQAVLMSIYRALKLRGLNPIATVAKALRTYVQTGTLPPLPEETVADG